MVEMESMVSADLVSVDLDSVDSDKAATEMVVAVVSVWAATEIMVSDLVAMGVVMLCHGTRVLFLLSMLPVIDVSDSWKASLIALCRERQPRGQRQQDQLSADG